MPPMVAEDPPDSPFVAIAGADATFTETLLESELFGHMRGASTRATQDRPGRFKATNGGTLLVDEIGEISPGMQVKLLRAIQDREIRRGGENKNRRGDVRILAVTNRDLVSGVASGTFRQDLYYRLKVVERYRKLKSYGMIRGAHAAQKGDERRVRRVLLLGIG